MVCKDKCRIGGGLNLSSKHSKIQEKSDSDEERFSRLEKGGLNYINKESNYLIISALFPIYLIIIQIINLLYILTAPPIPPVAPRPAPQPDPSLVNVFTPIILLLGISLFALINLRYLLIWKKNVETYKTQASNQQRSLTSLFYTIIKNMEKLKIVFITLNVLSLYYFVWYLLWALSLTDPHHPPPPIHVNILNVFSQVGLFLYLIFEWRHFFGWNQKLKQLKILEKQIFDDIFPKTVSN